MTVISISGLDAIQLKILEEQAEHLGVSLNQLLLDRLRASASAPPTTNSSFHDLDGLAGTWTKDDSKDFFKAIAPLEQVDPEMWS